MGTNLSIGAATSDDAGQDYGRTARPTPTSGRPEMRDLLLVFVGGAVGGSIRVALGVLLPSAIGPWPVTTFAINVVGAALLGMLAARTLPRATATRDTQLLVGTGLLGAFTTYSTVVVEAEALLRTHEVGIAMGHLTATLAAGIAAALGGWWLGARGSGQPSPAPGPGR